jgi:hypothetical protein
MNDKQRRRFERVLRGAAFGRERAADFPASGKGGQALARLGAAVTEIETLDTERASRKRETQQATGSKAEARAALRRQLAAISDTAETIGREHPELRGAFPRPWSNANDQNLLASARDFAAAVPAHAARFVEYEMPADFVESLNAVITNFERAGGQQLEGGGGSVAATAALEAALARAEDELERFDTAARNKYRGDAAALAAWESARRLERAPARRRGAATADPAKSPQPSEG